MVRKHEPVCQYLQGVEIGIQPDVHFGKAFAYGVGKTEEERVAGGKHDNLVVPFVLSEHVVQRHGDVYPAVAFRQERPHDAVVSLSSREYGVRSDKPEYFSREFLLSVVVNADDYKLHKLRI